jgi:hypothetical protein
MTFTAAVHMGRHNRRNDPELISWIGHGTPTMSLRYQHATTERDTAIADRLGALMRAAEQQPDADAAEFRSIGK